MYHLKRLSNENNFERLQLKHNISVSNVTVVNWHRTLNQEYMEFFLEQVFLGNQLQWKRMWKKGGQR